MPDDRPLLLLLDGHSLAYRAFYALPPDLKTSTGQVTNAVYGFTSMLIKLLADRQPAGVVVTFDKGRDVQRTEAYPEYKAGREKAPDEFREQLPLIEPSKRVSRVCFCTPSIAIRMMLWAWSGLSFMRIVQRLSFTCKTQIWSST